MKLGTLNLAQAESLIGISLQGLLASSDTFARSYDSDDAGSKVWIRIAPHEENSLLFYVMDMPKRGSSVEIIRFEGVVDSANDSLHINVDDEDSDETAEELFEDFVTFLEDAE